MKAPIHILHLEDDPHDATLVQETLRAGGIPSVTNCVQNREAFQTALEGGEVDLVLSAHTLPTFDAASATAMVRSRWPDVPVILVSGTIGEEAAIDSLRDGATDYVMKRHLSRLAPAIRRAMLEVEARANRRQLEAQVIESQKMEVVGQLASGVAHDFNNMLAVISGYTGLLEAELSPASTQRLYTTEIRHASDRAAGLTKQLLVFSRKQTVKPRTIDLNDVVRELEKLLRRLINENIELTVVYGEDVGRIKADSGYVGQVLMNLVVNARDAMPNGGTLVISTADATLDDPYVRAHPGAHAGEFVRLSVCDTGTGMTSEVRDQIFKPFFTTKPPGKGTGLGLPTCRLIVQQAGGHIEVDSQLGKGSTFEVYFPRSDGPVDAPVRPEHAGTLPGGSETLLVVEDERCVRDLACTILEGLGYKVLRASNGQEGLRVAREVGEQALDLVITDVVMPVMGGGAMVEWLRTTHPDIRVLFTSGYCDVAVDGSGAIEGGSSFLQKPYTAAVLAGRVRDLLDAAPPRVGS